MSSLQQYLQNALTIDQQETGEDVNYQATQAQLKAMGEEATQQALATLPFSIAEVYHGLSRIYQSGKAAAQLYTREGGIRDTISRLTEPSTEPFNIGDIASKIVGAGGEEAAARLAPYAKKYGLDLESVVKAGKGEGGVAAATQELKTQLGKRADAVTTQLKSEINRGVEQFTGSVQGIQSELIGKSQEALQQLHTKYSQVLNAYSPSDISNLSESGKQQFSQLQDLVKTSEVTPEGVTRLKSATDTFVKNIGLEKQLKQVTAAKEVLAGKAKEASTALEQRSRQLSDQHQTMLSAADEQIGKLQAQKESALQAVKDAQGRLQSRASDIMKEVPTIEQPSSTSRYRSAGSMNIQEQTKQGQSAIDEALVAKHQAISEGLDAQISKLQAGREQMVNQFQEKLQRETAPYRQTLSELQPAFQTARAEAESIGSRLLGSVGTAMEGLNVAGGIQSAVALGKSQLTTPLDRVQGGINVSSATRGIQALGQKGIQAVQEVGTQATEKLSQAATQAEQAAEKVLSGATKAGQSVAEVGSAAGEAGAALAGEGEAAAAASALPGIGEIADVGLGLAAGITALIDIFGGHHEQAPPPPPSQVVQFQHQQGIY